ncbi:hypothetical protein NMY22_g8667 [Coprinellus aureogranulatus]|nr:hypothetical protein NMY22_g8667 [Coprinellus aureogranulatus]
MSAGGHEYDEALLKAAPEIDKKQRQVSVSFSEPTLRDYLFRLSCLRCCHAPRHSNVDYLSSASRLLSLWKTFIKREYFREAAFSDTVPKYPRKEDPTVLLVGIGIGQWELELSSPFGAHSNIPYRFLLPARLPLRYDLFTYTSFRY